MFLWLKTLYRKRTFTWLFTFTQLYGLYQLYKRQIYLFSFIWIYRLRKGESIGLINWSIINIDSDNVEIIDFISSIVQCFDLEVSNIEIEYLKFIILSLNTASLDNSINFKFIYGCREKNSSI